ncbi:MAG: hypothetical protein U0136_12985 [Bdellovibrionota bacterium]
MSKYFPVNEVPTNGEAFCNLAGMTLPWIDYDSEERFRKNGGHPLYGPDSITYTINSHGFRSPELSETADIKVLSIGCSFVFGLGLPREALFHERFCATLRSRTGRTVVNWNLGSSGTGNDYIARMLHLAVPLLRPDIVLINFSQACRMEYITVLGDWIKYGPANDPSWFDRIGREVHTHLNELRSPGQEELRLFLNYRSVAELLKGRLWIHSFLEESALGVLEGHLERFQLAGAFQKLDVARDHAHPGPESHAVVADRYLQVFEANGGFARLSQLFRQ